MGALISNNCRPTIADSSYRAFSAASCTTSRRNNHADHSDRGLLKQVITNDANLPSDLKQEAKGSHFSGQYRRDKPNGCAAQRTCPPPT
jgi:hypothetical protein